MPLLAWIILSGVAMSALALVGSITLVLKETTLQRLLLPLVAFAAGSLLGGAFFHMLPTALHSGMDAVSVFAWAAGGFVTFFAVEQFLHWHHCHRETAQCTQPLTYLVLAGDGLHNFLGGLAVAGTFLASALTFLLGSLIAYAVSFNFSLAFLVPFAAGNFIYIGASDLVPEINKSHSSRVAAVHFACFVLGLGLLFALHWLSHQDDPGPFSL